MDVTKPAEFILVGEFSVLSSGVEQSAPRSVQGVGIALNRHTVLL